MISEKDVKEDQVLVEALYLSLDPAMRGWLNGTPFPRDPSHSISSITDALDRYKILHPPSPNRRGDERLCIM